MSEKKYPCLFGLKDTCEARKYVEESGAVIAEPSAEEKGVVEKALKATKGIQFDDKEVAKELGEALVEGVMEKMINSAMWSMKPTKAMTLSHYCGLCPILSKKK